MSLALNGIPAAVVSGVICLFVGAGLVLGVQAYTSQTDPEVAVAQQTGGENTSKETASPDGGSSKMSPKNGKGEGGVAPKTGSVPKMGAGSPPDYRLRLVQLVTKLDVLTSPKPLKVELTADQKKKAKELIADLISKDNITDEEAKTTLEGLLKLVEDQREIMEAAGYRWPAQGGATGGAGGIPGLGGLPGAPTVPVPPTVFKQRTNATHLKSLQETLEK
jgi:hypothetical protein